MNTVFLLLFLLSIPALIAGLVKPSLFKLGSRKLAGLIFGGIFIASFILFGVTTKDEEPKVVLEENSLINETSTTTENKISNNGPGVNKTSEVNLNTNNQYTYYSITEVVDGDTVKVNISGTNETLRLIGLDTPETVDPRKPVQCFGKEASNKGKELLIGKKVRIEKDSTQGDKDKYGRTLAYIYTEGGLFYNKYMIEQGYAHEYTYSTPYKYQAEFKQAQKTAEQNKAGLWSPSTCNGVTNQTENTSTPTATTPSSGKYYTSSASNATRYYPDTCPEWQNLSKSNLRTFNSLDELLAVYPKRTLADVCK